MKKLFMVLPLVFLLCFTFSCQKPVEEVAEEIGVSPLSDEDVATIKAMGPALDKANLAGDFDAVVEMMTEDILLMNPNEQIIEGRDEALKWFNAFKPATFTEHKHELLEVDGYGDIAFARGAYKNAFIFEGIDEPIKGEGKTLLILRKQTDGSWLISKFCWSSDLPLPE
jgi:ketosteroid isomerase-like protein